MSDILTFINLDPPTIHAVLCILTIVQNNKVQIKLWEMEALAVGHWGGGEMDDLTYLS